MLPEVFDLRLMEHDECATLPSGFNGGMLPVLFDLRLMEHDERATLPSKRGRSWTD